MSGVIAADSLRDSQAQQRPPRRYEVIRELASGGMATVWLARGEGSLGVSRFVAIKRLHPHLASDGDFVKMFLDEANLASRIKHPNVVPVIDVFESEGLSLVMEYIEGETLLGLWRLAFRNGERIPFTIGARVMLDALTGLQAAHELCDETGKHLKIIHRDVSPQNILVGIDGVSRITDFGIAKATSRLANTREGLVKGKFAYMAPEQFNQGEVDQRVDVFTAGIVAWELFAGTRMFPTEPDAVIIKRLMNERVVELSKHAPDVPDAIARAVMRALERDPAQRWPTCGAFAAALSEAVETLGGPAPYRNVGILVQRLVAAERRRSGPSETVTRPSSPRLRAVGAPATPDETAAPHGSSVRDVGEVELDPSGLTDAERSEARPIPAASQRNTPAPTPTPPPRRTFVPMAPRPTMPRIPTFQLPLPPSKSTTSSPPGERGSPLPARRVSSPQVPTVTTTPEARVASPHTPVFAARPERRGVASQMITLPEISSAAITSPASEGTTPTRASQPPPVPRDPPPTLPPLPPPRAQHAEAPARVREPSSLPVVEMAPMPAMVPVQTPFVAFENRSAPVAEEIPFVDRPTEMFPLRTRRQWWYLLPIVATAAVMSVVVVALLQPNTRTITQVATVTAPVALQPVAPQPTAPQPVAPQPVAQPDVPSVVAPPTRVTSPLASPPDRRLQRRQRRDRPRANGGVQRTRDGRIIIR